MSPAHRFWESGHIFWGTLFSPQQAPPSSPSALVFKSNLIFHSPTKNIGIQAGSGCAGQMGPLARAGPGSPGCCEEPRARPGLRSGSTWDLWVGSSAKVQWLLSLQVLGSIFFAIACFLYKSPPGSSDGLEASLPSQSSASDNLRPLGSPLSSPDPE